MKEGLLTQTEAMILGYLEGKGFVSPTQIGRDLHGGHSAWASPICLRLVKKGYLVRDERGWYCK